MSSFLAHAYPGDAALDLALVAAGGALLASGTAWLVSQFLIRHAAIRHVVLLSGLVALLVVPALAWMSAASGLTVVTFSILPAFRDVTEPSEVGIAPHSVSQSPSAWGAKLHAAFTCEGPTPDDSFEPTVATSSDESVRSVASAATDDRPARETAEISDEKLVLSGTGPRQVAGNATSRTKTF